MKRRLVALIGIGLLALAAELNAALAQSNVQIFYVGCADKGVIELSGEMASGYDVYYQIFSGPDGSGSALTALRRVPVSGTYAVSDSAAFLEGATIPVGSVSSAQVSIARESDSTRSLFKTTVNDLQDGCATSQAPPVTSIDLGSPGSAATPTAGSGVLSPFGGEVNPGMVPEPLVKIGARGGPQRSQTAGLIFAECDRYPLTNPGVLYDTDDLVVFWSWFAKTPQQLQDHIDHAQYSVTLNGETFPVVERTEIQRRGANYWVFYVARIGRSWQPGEYGIAYKLTWDTPITDGYEQFGPGTAHEIEGSSCTFDILPNPFGVQVAHAAPPIPRP